MKKKYIAGNWKMHKTIPESVALAKELVGACAGVTDTVMIAPPFTALAAVKEALKGSKILLGAQNMASVEQGAHTGEVSVLMLKDLGVDVVILGHSERRAIYGESDDLINKKVKLAIAQGLDVILCVGETLDEREAGKANAVVTTQTKAGLAGVSASELGKVTIAYEPVWAIGTGKNATGEDADAIHAVIRSVVANLYSKQAADSLVIQYGGSVKPDNAKSLLTMPNIDGALVGGASLKSDQFVPIVKYSAQ